MINAHENVRKTIRKEELDLEDIFASIYTLADELRITNRDTSVMLDLQYIIAYAVEGRKMVAEEK
jgi:hypothetical protein